MFTITEEQFDKLRLQHPDYIARTSQRHEHSGKVCNAGEWCAFEGVITGDYCRGTSLIFQHIHFKIV